MSEVLFTHSYFYKFDPKQLKSKQFYPPLGTIYAASFIRDSGYEVSLFDTNLKNDPIEIISDLKNHNPKYLIIYDDGFNYLTKMCLLKMRKAAFKLIEIGKKYNCKVIVSSSDSTDQYEKYLDNGADFVLLGEAEITLLELLNSLKNSFSEYPQIKGITYKKEGKFINTGRREILNNLDNLPQPAWDLINVDEYKNIWINKHGYFALNIATTRGCPFKCNWCAKPIYGNRYNSRSPENVLNEIEYLINEFGINYIWFCDDIFGLKPGWVKEFNRLIKDRKLVFKYKIQSRVDLLLQEDTIEDLAQSGADIVWVGAESGSQKILDSMDKGTSVEQIYSAAKLLKEKHIKIGLFLQLGYLGETKNDIEKTLKMLLDIMPDDVGISISYPLPGTKFYGIVKDQLKEKTNWNDSDDLDLMYQNNFSREYYKKLHRFIHKKFRREQGIIFIKKFFNNPFTLSSYEFKKALATFYYIPQIIIYKYWLKKLQ
ncbi:MAG: radical SAM protein [Ignavibacteriales bacterium CG_4_9_14_3_um_filter_30_11]|nr:MAG: radical SAM protein [Ignavibacteriales bacterium CG_4_9_14_3_um_filter_30_11]